MTAKLLDGKQLAQTMQAEIAAEAAAFVKQHGLRNGIRIEGMHVVVLGRSNIVGKPLALILMQKAAGANATVTVCHSRSRDLSDITRQGDIVVAAIGQPEFLKAEMIRPGAVVVD